MIKEAGALDTMGRLAAAAVLIKMIDSSRSRLDTNLAMSRVEAELARRREYSTMRPSMEGYRRGPRLFVSASGPSGVEPEDAALRYQMGFMPNVPVGMDAGMVRLAEDLGNEMGEKLAAMPSFVSKGVQGVKNLGTSAGKGVKSLFSGGAPVGIKAPSLSATTVKAVRPPTVPTATAPLPTTPPMTSTMASPPPVNTAAHDAPAIPNVLTAPIQGVKSLAQSAGRGVKSLAQSASRGAQSAAQGVSDRVTALRRSSLTPINAPSLAATKGIEPLPGAKVVPTPAVHTEAATPTAPEDKPINFKRLALGVGIGGAAAYGLTKATGAATDYLSQEAPAGRWGNTEAGAPRLAYGTNQYGYAQL